MTFDKYFSSAVGENNSPYYNQFPTQRGSNMVADRDFSMGYDFGQDKSKSKSKAAAKKQLAMSAMTLLAFLFFLNILQNCLKDHTQMKTTEAQTMMSSNLMVAPARSPLSEEYIIEALRSEGLNREKRETEEVEAKVKEVDEETWRSAGMEEKKVWKKRDLLSVTEKGEGKIEIFTPHGVQYIENTGDPRNGWRASKFITNYKPESQWQNELSPVSEQDIEHHQTKTNLLNMLNGKQKTKPPEKDSTIRKLVNSPILANIRNEIPKLSEYKTHNDKQAQEKGEKIKSIEFQNEEKLFDNVADFEEFMKVSNKNETAEEIKSIAFGDPTIKNYKTRYNTKYRKNNKKWYPKYHESPEKLEHIQKEAQVMSEGKQSYNQEHHGALITPRTRRSELSTAGSPQDEEVRWINERYQGSLQVPTPLTESVKYGEENQVFSNHRYDNHKDSQWKYYQQFMRRPEYPVKSIWLNKPEKVPEQTNNHLEVEQTTNRPRVQSGNLDVGKIAITTEKNHYIRQQPHFYRHQIRYPVRGPPHTYKRPMDPYHKQFFKKNHPGGGPEYYPMSVVGQFQGPSPPDIAINFMKTIWGMLSSIAKPIARLVPMSKVSPEDQVKCYDLFVCEALRVGKMMGPTTEKIAVTFSNILNWISPEERKVSIRKATEAAKSNTCMEQIRNCEATNGGHSTITMIAQMLEYKSEPRDNRDAQQRKKDT